MLEKLAPINRAISWWLIKRLIRVQFPSVRQLSTTDLADWLATPGRAYPLLLDVRTPVEYQTSHLYDAKLVPHSLTDLANKVDYSTPIVVYCSVGYRSSAIVHRLEALGYKNLFNLSGSIFQWVNENRPVYQNGNLVNTVHPYQKFWQHLLTKPPDSD